MCRWSRQSEKGGLVHDCWHGKKTGLGAADMHGRVCKRLSKNGQGCAITHMYARAARPPAPFSRMGPEEVQKSSGVLQCQFWDGTQSSGS